MLTHVERRSKRLAIMLLAALIAAMASRAGAGGGDAAGNDAQPLPGGTGASNAGTTAPSSPVAAELEELRAAVQAQQEQFAARSKELESERAALREELQRIAALEAKLGIEPEGAAGLDAVDINTPVAASAPAAVQGSQSQPINIVAPENPLSIKIGAADFTPGGFVDLTGIFRSRDSGTGLGASILTGTALRLALISPRKLGRLPA